MARFLTRLLVGWVDIRQIGSIMRLSRTGYFYIRKLKKNIFKVIYFGTAGVFYGF
jgi:hypothetical protein